MAARRGSAARSPSPGFFGIDLDRHPFLAPPRDASFPYVALGETVETDWSSGDEPGGEIRLTLHVWSRAAGEREAWSILGQLMQRLRSPLALRIPLFDPDKILEATLPLVRPLFTTFGFVAWLALVLFGAVLAILHWPELTTDMTDRVLAAENVALLMCVYPIVKSLHELGHAYATTIHKAQGVTVDRTLLLGSDDLYRQAAYVGLSRGRDRNDLYVAHDSDIDPERHGAIDLGEPTDRLASSFARDGSKTLAVTQRSAAVSEGDRLAASRAELAALQLLRRGVAWPGGPRGPG